jgi:hypothetical protein
LHDVLPADPAIVLRTLAWSGYVQGGVCNRES